MGRERLVLVFGDSITWGAWDPEGGWVQRLRRYMEAKDKVEKNYTAIYNLGIDGDDSTGVRKRFEPEARTRLFEGAEVTMIFAVGINDSRMDEQTGETKTPVRRFSSNLAVIFARATRMTQKVYCVGLTRVNEKKTRPTMWNANVSYINDVIKRFDDALKITCRNSCVPYIPVSDVFDTEKHLDDDGLHPNAKGHELVYEKVKTALEKAGILSR